MSLIQNKSIEDKFIPMPDEAGKQTVQVQLGAEQPRVKPSDAVSPQLDNPSNTKRSVSIYRPGISEGEKRFEHLVLAHVGLLDETSKDVFSQTHYSKDYQNLSLRQKRNIEMFGHLSPDEVQVLSQEVLDDLCRETKTNISNIRANLSAAYFSESPIDFAFHLLEFKQAAHIAQKRLIKAFQDYKYCRNSIIVDVKPKTTDFLLSARGLVLLPPEIGSLSHIKTLKIPSNRLQSLPPELFLLTQLEVLCATKNRLTSLPAGLGDMTGLIELDLSCNELTNLPKELGRLFRLKFLDVRKNRLIELPSEIGLLTQLEKLNIHKNTRCPVPAEIGQLTNLQWLKIHFNPLGSTLDDLAGLTKLKVLSVSISQFQVLPSTLIQRKEEGSLTIVTRW